MTDIRNKAATKVIVLQKDGDDVVNPTLADGDVKVSIDFADFQNIAVLPTIEPAGTKYVKIALSAAERNSDFTIIEFSDVAGNQWDDASMIIETDNLQTDWTDGGRLDNILDGLTVQPSSIPNTTNAHIFTRNEAGVLSGIACSARLVDNPSGTAAAFVPTSTTGTSDATGLWEFTAFKGATYKITLGSKEKLVQIPSNAANPYELTNEVTGC
jgi:hypothetical protein